MCPLPSDLYDRDYFLSDKCEGWDRFRESRGLSAIKERQVRALGPAPGLRVLDAGCGRGEVLLACARAGAEVAGLDYAQAAVELTTETLAGVPAADIRRGDVTRLPWEDASFDRILFADVIEHVDPALTVKALSELRRVLRPGGLLLVHTAPNKLFVKVGWPLCRPAMRLMGRGAAADALDRWLGEAEAYHVNEQSVHGLRRALRKAGFRRPAVWIDPDVLRGGGHFLTKGLDGGVMALAGRLAGTRPVRLLLGNDLYALARAP